MAFAQFNQPISGTVPGVQTNVNGVLQEATGTPLSIQGSVQPASSRDLLSLPEGRRTSKTYAVCTKSVLKEGYRLTIYGQDFTCVGAEAWLNGVLPHHKGLFQRTEDLA